MPPNPVLVSLLDKLVRGYAADMAAMGRALREVFEQDQEGFYAAILPLWRRSDDSRGFRYLAALLVSNGLIARVLCEGALKVGEAIALAKLAIQIDPMLDIALAKRAAEGTDPDRAGETERVLAVLAAISGGARVLPPISLLLRHPNRRVRSKAALLLGRGTRNPRWVEKVLNEQDDRVRANAVESIWGVEAAGVREVLEAAAADGNNRVAGNALLALYRLGEASSCQAIAAMATHESAAHRATAAWVMGELADPRFGSVLARLMADANAGVRRRAHLSIKQLRESVSRAQRLPGAGLLVGPPRPAGDEWKVLVALLPGTDATRINPRPAQFVPFEGDRPVFEYSVLPLNPPESLAVAILLPAAPASSTAIWIPGIHACLESKRNADLWAPLKYRESADFTEAGAAPPRYSTNARALAESLVCTGTEILPEFVRKESAAAVPKLPADVVPGFWTAVRRCAGFGQGPARGARHMILLNTHEREKPEDLEVLVNSIKAQRIRVHVISTAGCAVLEDLSLRTGGTCYAGVAECSASECLKFLYGLMLPRYTIRYRRQFPDRPLRLQVRTGEGWLDGVPFTESAEPHQQFAPARSV